MLSIPVPGVGELRVPTPPPDEDLLAAAESVGAQIAQFARAGREARDFEARRQAMLDVAFDSVFTMDDGGMVLAANRAAERTFGYKAEEIVGRELAALIIPPSLRDAHRDGLARYLKTGRGPVVGRRVELTAMRRDGSEFPVELVVTRPDVPGERVFYGYLRDLTARNVAEAALHRLADEQAALRRVATAVAAESDPSRLFALLSEEVGRLLEARPRTLLRFDAEARGRSSARWQRGPARAAGRDADAARRRHRRDARLSDGRAGADGQLRRAEGEWPRAARVRRAGRRWPRRCSWAGRLWGAMVVSISGARPVLGGRRAADRVFRGAGGAGARERAGARGAGASRARIVQAGDAERRRLERNLHDGAQQRLVSLALMLRLAARRHPDDADLASAGEELSHALQELRELARGIHPAVLTERGLEPAVRALADRAPVPVELRSRSTSGCPGRSRPPRTTSSPRRSRTSPSTPTPRSSACRIDARTAAPRLVVADDGAGGADPRRRHRPARARRPRRGARRAPESRARRRGHHPPRRAMPPLGSRLSRQEISPKGSGPLGFAHRFGRRRAQGERLATSAASRPNAAAPTVIPATSGAGTASGTPVSPSGMPWTDTATRPRPRRARRGPSAASRGERADRLAGACRRAAGSWPTRPGARPWPSPRC